MRLLAGLLVSTFVKRESDPRDKRECLQTHSSYYYYPIKMSIVLFLTLIAICQSYKVHQVATLLDEETFLPHIKRTLASQDHRTMFVRFL